MSADALLARLDKVRRTGPGRWKACCSAHPDRNPSLLVRELDDGRVLVRCMSQNCAFADIVAGAGVDMAEMFPPAPPRAEGYKPERRPFFREDVFDLALHEFTVASLVAFDVHQGKTVSEDDYARLLVAAERLESIGSAAYGKR